MKCRAMSWGGRCLSDSCFMLFNCIFFLFSFLILNNNNETNDSSFYFSFYTQKKVENKSYCLFNGHAAHGCIKSL